MNKQETLEEAAEKWVFEINGNKWSNNDNTAGDNYGSFITGAKWQAERSYSQNDMWEAYKASNTIFEDEIALRQEFEEWFEQFKKQ